MTGAHSIQAEKKRKGCLDELIADKNEEIKKKWRT